MEIPGHSSLAMLERYTHPREQRNIEALEAINRPLMDTTWSQSETGVAVSHTAAGGNKLKAPHHGSRHASSEEFVAATQPTIAVVSAGRANRFGHPAPSVVQRYREAGAALFRTDQHGAITVETDGTAVHVNTQSGQKFFLDGHSPRRPRRSRRTHTSCTQGELLGTDILHESLRQGHDEASEHAATGNERSRTRGYRVRLADAPRAGSRCSREHRSASDVSGASVDGAGV